ncbi:MAG: PQQ-dependent sugar dehydrogenase, partial [Terriglobia bacterium]
MTKRIVSSRSILLVLGLASITLAFQEKPPQLPAPYHTPSASNAPKVIPRPDGAQLSLPKGFMAAVYAEGFEKPRFMALGPGGEVLISDSADKGTVYVLRDRDKDGRTESKEKLIDGLYRPYGLAFWKDYLYVAETTSLKRYKYNSSATTVETPGEEVVSMKDFTKAHWTRTVLFDRKGEKMYLAIGSGSNVDAGDDPKRAAINRYNPDGT